MTVYIEKCLAKRKLQGNLRALQLVNPSVDFASNDYLGLARSDELAKRTTAEWQTLSGIHNGLGSTGSRLLTGNSMYAQALEQSIATFHGFESGLLFNCGYMANLGLLSAIAGRDDQILYDACIHASTHDGMRLSLAQTFPFRHNDLNHLERRLKQPVRGTRFVCIESIYSTDGSQAPLKEICQLTHQYGALLIVDEAHAVGACGPGGRGLVAQFNLNSQVFALVGTFGKAVASQGAIILGSNQLKQALLNFAHAVIYTTTLPLHALAVIKCSYELFPQMEKERQQLQSLIQNYRHHFHSASHTHIQTYQVPGNQAVKKAAQTLISHGYDVRPLLSPTVRRGGEVLRICLHAYNTLEELSLLIKLLKQDVA